jgi:Domain of unknown function (DUF6457)
MEGTLYDWVAEAAEALDLPAEAAWVAERETVQQVLDLARDVAQGATRPAAPVGAFLAGVAVGLEYAYGPEVLDHVRSRLAPTLNPEGDGEE